MMRPSLRERKTENENSKPSKKHHTTPLPSPAKKNRTPWVVAVIVLSLTAYLLSQRKSDSPYEASTDLPPKDDNRIEPEPSSSFTWNPFATKPSTARHLNGVGESGEVTDPAALSGSLPLEISGVYPSADNLKQIYLIAGREAITAVYNRAVIKLGSDFGSKIPDELIPFKLSGAENIPGKFRWVTTSIFRFDPDIDWPTDLKFEVVFNPDFKSFDGASITQAPRTYKYSTPNQKIRIESVTSELAKDLTDGAWFSRENQEVPPDGRIRLSFDSDVDIDLISSAFKLSPEVSTQPPFTFETCDKLANRSSTRCVVAVLHAKLDLGTTYFLTLPGGTKYHALSGPLTEKISVNFQGLFDFRFDMRLHWGNTISHKRFQLALWHGLSDENSFRDFYEVFSITENNGRSLNYTLILRDAVILEVNVDISPERIYEFKFSASENIRDGFGLPLRKSAATFNSSTPQPIFFTPEETGNVVLDPDFSNEFVALTRSFKKDEPGDFEVKYWNVNEQNLESLLALVVRDHRAKAGFIGELPQAILTRQDTQNISRLSTDMSALGDSGLAIAETTYRQQLGHWRVIKGKEEDTLHSRYSYVMRTNVTATATRLLSNALVVWVTDMIASEPVENAEVLFYTQKSQWSYDASMKLSLLGVETTNKDGIVIFNMKHNDDIIIPVVKYRGQISVLPTTYTFGGVGINNLRATMFTDRKIYRPGEALHLKGYVRLHRENPVNLPKICQVEVDWGNNAKEKTDVSVNQEFGSFYSKFYVPEDASQIWISLICGHSVFYTDATISDPRLPTGSLLFSSSEDFIKPQDPRVNLHFETSTYSGSPVQSEISVVWKLSRQPQNLVHHMKRLGRFAGSSSANEEPDEKGQFTLRTNSSGVADFEFVLANLTKPLTDGNVHMKATWIGPTREQVTKNINLQIRPSKIQLQSSLNGESPLPGDFFVVVADVTATDDSAIDGKKVRMQLISVMDKKAYEKDANSGKITWDLPTVELDECESEISENIAKCSFSLPSVGEFVIVMSVLDDSGYEVSSILEVGRSLEEWKESPLDKFDGVTMKSDKSQYLIGDAVTLTFKSHFERAHALIIWGNQFKTERKFVSLKEGNQDIQIQLGEECLFGGCDLVAIVSVPKQNSDFSLKSDVPISPLYDPSAARSFTLRHHLKVTDGKDARINVQLELSDKVALPGTETSVSVSLTDSNGNPIEGEVVLWAVDKSILDLKQSPLINVTEATAVDFSQGIEQSLSSIQNLLTEKVYRSKLEIMERRWNLDPWASEMFGWLFDDQKWLAQFITRITEFPAVQRFSEYFTLGEEMAYGAASPEHMLAKSRSHREVATAAMMFSAEVATDRGFLAESPEGMSIRSNFNLVPLFEASLRVNGNATVTFKLPDNISSFAIRAMAVSKYCERFGSKEEILIARRKISLQPSIPRVVRVGDKFMAGVTIAQTDASEYLPSIALHISLAPGHILSTSQQAKQIELRGLSPVEVLFDFEALALGEATIRITALSLEGFNTPVLDALEATLEVQAPQLPVFVATSFAIEAKNASSPWKEGVELPASEKGSGSLSLEVGVGKLPTLLVLSEALNVDGNRHISGDRAVASLAPYASLLPHQGSFSAETKNVLKSRFDQGLKLSEDFTDKYSGLQYYRSTTAHNYESMNANALALSALMREKGVEIPKELTQRWIRAYENSVAESLRQQRSQPYISWHNMALAKLFTGAGWNNQELNRKSEVSFETLARQGASCGITCRAAIALIYARDKPAVGAEFVSATIKDLENSIRVQGRTAYFSVGGQHPASMMDQVFALQLFITARPKTTNPLIEKVSNYISQNAASSSSSPFSTAFASLVLSNYDQMKGNSAPNLQLLVSSGEDVLMKEKFDSANQYVRKNSWELDQLTVEQKPLEFNVAGKGEVSVALGIHFVPKIKFNESIYRGIFVEKSVNLVDPFTGEITGPSITNVTSGNVVRVTIQITSPDFIAGVDLIDLLPGGLEAFDPKISQSDSSPNRQNWWWWNSYEQVTKKDKVLFHWERFRAGTQTVTYDALAVTSGTFVLPSAKSFATEQPELMGLSSATKFTVD